MTTSELKSKIAESKNKGWYQSLVFNLNLPHVGYKISLTGMAAAYDYVLKQCNRFAEFENLPEELNHSKRKFQDIKLAIVQIINQDKENEYKWKDAVSELNDTRNKVFPADIPETDFLVNLYLNKKDLYKHAYNFITGNISYISKDQFVAYTLAYEFLNGETSKIAERSNVEQKAISRIKSDFNKQVSESETQMTEYLSHNNDKVNLVAKEFDELVKSKNEHYFNWYNSVNNGFQEFFTASKANIKEAENLYREKLKMEAPAKYWNDRATALKTEGKKWLSFLIITIVVGIGLLIWSLAEISAGTLDQIFQNNGTAIKWSVVFITLISFIAFAIKIFSKLTFSSYHLVRDAEEREQLTYVYLALKKEKGIDETERHLIMQSLFSRADSGLLKDDSGPTMPGNIIDQVAKR